MIGTDVDWDGCRCAMPSDSVLVACNVTPVVCYGYRIGVPALTDYRELLNADSHHYGGSIVRNLGGLRAEPVPMHGYGQSVL